MFAKSRGFHDLTHEWQRTHHIEQFDQVDSRAYLIHPWMKLNIPSLVMLLPQIMLLGLFAMKLLSREETKRLVEEHYHRLDVKAIRDFCEFLGYSEAVFWAIVEKFYNTDLFEKNQFGEWVLKHPVWENN